ncbi:MAG TPA: glycosyltransferase, partial [Candidatus Avibacteroides faecavium]|nr:glycosyltransferase [Candidatus Avibacteroides faecavium]
MKIIVVNKFYYNRGGDCTATLATERVLREHGHEVAVFAMDYPQNLPSQWQRYFAPQADFGGSPGKRLRALGRLFSPWDVRRAFTRLLDDFRPDVVHLNNIHSYLSPVVAEVAHARGVRVVWTMHDYKAVCPSYVCLRGGQVCTECMGGTSAVVRHRCMKGSLLQSTFAWLESLWWGRKRLARATDRFIAPSEFVRQMLLRGGFAAGQVVTVPHCVPRRPGELLDERGDYYCYV